MWFTRVKLITVGFVVTLSRVLFFSLFLAGIASGFLILDFSSVSLFLFFFLNSDIHC